MSIKDKERREKEAWLKALGKQLRAERVSKNLSGSDLSPVIEKANLFRIERGEVNPSIYLVKQICDFLEVDFGELYKRIK